MFDQLPFINIWIRSESANYGAEKYANNILNVLNSCENKYRLSPVTKISYITPKTTSFIASAFLYLPFIFRKRKGESINIYTFPFMPFHLDTDRDILIFHHADPLRGSIISRITEAFGLFLMLFASRKLLIITVSPFWNKFLKHKFGFVNVKTIYNPLSTEIIKNFKKQSFDSTFSSESSQKIICKDNPIIYLGNASPKKGWPLAFKIAKKVYPNADYWVSGNNYTCVEHPDIKHFKGSDSAFIEFLQSVDISIFYSQFLEGWNRTLVETALLSQSYVLTYSKSGGAVDAMDLLPNTIAFNDENELYNQLSKIYNEVKFNSKKQINKSSFETVISMLEPSIFYQQWHSVIDTFINKNSNHNYYE